MKVFAFLAPLFRAQSLPFAVALVLSLSTLLAGVALLGVSGWFLTAAALTTMAASFNLFGPSSLIRGLSFIRILSRYGEKLVGHDATLRLLADLRTHVFGRLFDRLPLAGNGIGRGDLVSRLTADIDALEAVFIVGIAPIVTSLLSGIVMAGLIRMILPQALLAYAVAMFLAVIVVPVLLLFACGRLGARHVTVSADARSQLLNALDGHMDLVAFGRTAHVQQGFGHVCKDLGTLRSRLALRASLASMAIQLLTAGSMLAILITGIPLLNRGAIGAATLVGLLLATLASFEGAAAVVRGVARFGQAMAAAERVGGLVAGGNPVLRPAAQAMPCSSRLTADHLCFAYQPDQPVIRNLQLTVEPGERIALMGRSGCGKSTLLSLLIGLEDAQSGQIRLGGVGTSLLDREALHGKIGLLAQDAPAFMGTIRDNLLIGDPDADDSRLMEVLASVRLDGLLRELPEGLGTYVGETGRTLSIGQVRRLCLARVLLSKADILLLDEPTSSLDQEMEACFFADLAGIADGRTIIVATHAPRNVLGGFDKRYAMRAGALFTV